MKKTHNLRCFVAMAFGYEDTDNLYNNHIKPTIIKAGLTPIRIDKLLHNDRIDARIREEILKADVIIADLTYSRPSVYWEAGYAERTIPVIYTCRRDHFKPQLEDRHGNFRVHFDLINANILSWLEKGNVSFANELRKRLLYVTAKSRQEKEKQTQLTENRKKFSFLSASDKRQQITIATRIPLLTNKYALVKIPANEKNPLYTDEVFKAEVIGGLFWKKTNKTGILISAHYCYPSLIQNNFYSIESRMVLNSLSKYSPISTSALPKSLRIKAQGIKRLRIIKLIPVLSSISTNRIETYLHNWSKLNSEDWYYLHPQETNGIPTTKEVIFISGIKSTEEHFDKVMGIIKTINTDDSN